MGSHLLGDAKQRHFYYTTRAYRIAILWYCYATHVLACYNLPASWHVLVGRTDLSVR